MRSSIKFGESKPMLQKGGYWTTLMYEPCLCALQIEYLNSLYGVDVPLLLMNSFKTDDVTSKLLNKYRMHNLTIHTFGQVSAYVAIKGHGGGVSAGEACRSTNPDTSVLCLCGE